MSNSTWFGVLAFAVLIALACSLPSPRPPQGLQTAVAGFREDAVEEGLLDDFIILTPRPTPEPDTTPVVPANLGGRVFNDLDGDGIQDPGEFGVERITVSLWTSDNSGNPLQQVASTSSDTDGTYLFVGLRPGVYVVEFVAPAGRAFSPQNIGEDDSRDSDVDQITSITDPITLGAGEDNRDVDAGLTTGPGGVSDGTPVTLALTPTPTPQPQPTREQQDRPTPIPDNGPTEEPPTPVPPTLPPPTLPLPTVTLPPPTIVPPPTVIPPTATTAPTDDPPDNNRNISVNTNNDLNDGMCDASHCSLREAIILGNSIGSTINVFINFNIPGGGLQTISPTSPLPTIIRPMTINAITQPGAACGSWPPTLQVRLSGSGAPAGTNGFTIASSGVNIRGFDINGFSGGSGITYNIGGNGSNITCNFITGNNNGIFIGNGVSGNNIGSNAANNRNLISGNSSAGVLISGAATNGNTVSGNYIGVSSTASSTQPNGTSGVVIDGAANNTIGPGNILAGNVAHGVNITNGATGNTVIGNLIGVNTADTGLPNGGNGVNINASQTNRIGGIMSSARNIISSNTGAGVLILNGSSGNLVGRNFIGTDSNGLSARPNSTGVTVNNATGTAIQENLISGNSNAGVLISNGSTANTISLNFIGTNNTGAASLRNGSEGVLITDSSTTIIGGSAGRNIIAFNTTDGIAVTGAGSLGNRIRDNSIFQNGDLGIDLASNGVTLNDSGDGDTGPNNLQNFPVISSTIAFSNSLTMTGFLDVMSDTYRIQFFTNDSCDGSGNGEGQTLLTDRIVTLTSPSPFTFNTGSAVPLDKFITSTAISSGGNTSEFSNCTPVQGQTIVASTFDTNVESWTILNNGATIIPTHNLAGGNPGGYISSTDVATTTWFFNAPAAFLGNQLALYGNGALKFDRSRDGSAGFFSTTDVFLVGSGITLRVTLAPTTAVFPNWTSYAVLLNETDGWVNAATSVPATSVDMMSVLTNVTALRIRGETTNLAGNTGNLDNVRLENQ